MWRRGAHDLTLYWGQGRVWRTLCQVQVAVEGGAVPADATWSVLCTPFLPMTGNYYSLCGVCDEVWFSGLVSNQENVFKMSFSIHVHAYCTHSNSYYWLNFSKLLPASFNLETRSWNRSTMQ